MKVVDRGQKLEVLKTTDIVISRRGRPRRNAEVVMGRGHGAWPWSLTMDLGHGAQRSVLTIRPIFPAQDRGEQKEQKAGGGGFAAGNWSGKPPGGHLPTFTFRSDGQVGVDVMWRHPSSSGAVMDQS